MAISLAGATLGAGIIGAGASIFGANKSEQASKANTAAQIAWEREKFKKETELANTAHQREIADLEAAGLNKIFTVNSGGATVPQMGNITPQMPDYSGYAAAGEHLRAGITTAADINLKEKLAKEQINQMIANRIKTEAETNSLIDDMKPGRAKDQAIAESKKKQELYEKQITTEDKKALHIAAQAAFQEIENAIRNKDLKWYEADKIINYVLRIIPFAGIGALTRIFGGKSVKEISTNLTKNAIKNPKNIKIGDFHYTKRYKLTRNGVLDVSTGELLPTSWQ